MNPLAYRGDKSPQTLIADAAVEAMMDVNAHAFYIISTESDGGSTITPAEWQEHLELQHKATGWAMEAADVAAFQQYIGHAGPREFARMSTQIQMRVRPYLEEIVQDDPPNQHSARRNLRITHKE